MRYFELENGLCLDLAAVATLVPLKVKHGSESDEGGVIYLRDVPVQFYGSSVLIDTDAEMERFKKAFREFLEEQHTKGGRP